MKVIVLLKLNGKTIRVWSLITRETAEIIYSDFNEVIRADGKRYTVEIL